MIKMHIPEQGYYLDDDVIEFMKDELSIELYDKHDKLDMKAFFFAKKLSKFREAPTTGGYFGSSPRSITFSGFVVSSETSGTWLTSDDSTTAVKYVGVADVETKEGEVVSVDLSRHYETTKSKSEKVMKPGIMDYVRADESVAKGIAYMSYDKPTVYKPTSISYTAGIDLGREHAEETLKKAIKKTIREPYLGY